MKYKKQFLALLALLAFGFYACEGGGLSPFLDAIDGPSNDAPHDGDSIDPEDGVAPDPDSAERPDGSICTPGETKCDGSIHKKCNATGLAWVDTTCGEGTICTKEGCVSTICTPNTVECNDAGQRVVCNIDGTAYSTPTDCDEGYACGVWPVPAYDLYSRYYRVYCHKYLVLRGENHHNGLRLNVKKTRFALKAHVLNALLMTIAQVASSVTLMANVSPNPCRLPLKTWTLVRFSSRIQCKLRPEVVTSLTPGA